jgi:hypothetical protein
VTLVMGRLQDAGAAFEQVQAGSRARPWISVDEPLVPSRPPKTWHGSVSKRTDHEPANVHAEVIMVGDTPTRISE